MRKLDVFKNVGSSWFSLGVNVLIGFFLSPYIPRVIYGPLLIVTYAVATAALELAPQRVMALLAALGDSRRKP